MSDLFFARFSATHKDRRRASFAISTDRSSIIPKTPALQEEANSIPVQDDDSDKRTSGDVFFSINQEIFNTFVAYYDLAPAVISITQLLPRQIIEQEIKRQFIEKGTHLETTEEYEIYSIPQSLYRTFRQDVRRIDASAIVGAGLDRFFVMGLISLYDQFIYNLARAVIDSRPHIIFSSEKSFTYKDIHACTTVDDIKDIVIENELDTLLRSSHDDQLKWFSEKLDMKIEPEAELKARFIELCERRNLFAHTGGRVSRHYLKKVKFSDPATAPAVGSTLSVGRKYFESAVETVIEIAVQLVYVVWQKAEKDTSGKASKALIDLTYSLIADSKYSLALRILEFILNVKPSNMDDKTRKTHLINHSNTMKMLKMQNFCERIDKEDWSVATIDYRLCIASLKEDTDSFVDLLERAVKSESVSKTEIREWPVFTHVRSDPRVLKKFEELFSEPMI